MNRLSLALLLVCACSSTPHLSMTDAGTMDAGSMNAGDAGQPMADAGPQAVGGGCSQDTDCTSGHCDTRVPGGYCIQSCADNTSCPSGSVCEETGQGRAYCVALCMSSADCSGKNTCLGGGADICVPGAAGCQASTDCGASETCDTTTGLCSGAIPVKIDIGAACTQDSDCSGGRRPFCIPDSSDFWGGYCSAFCRSQTMCGAGNECVQGITTGPSGQPIGLCLQGCSKNSDCRSQYNCITMQDQSFCFPYCHTDADCIENGATCDPSTGLCSGGSLDAGTADAGMEDAGTDDAGMDAGTTDAGVDAGPVDAGTWDGGYPAPFPTPPQVATGGGPVLKSPKFVPIFFSNDDPAQVAAIADFDSKVGATGYWTSALGEYGVGAASSMAPVMINEIATGTLSDTSIQQWLADKITAGTLPFPDANTLFVLHYPAPMTISLQGQLSCQFFGGYHSDFMMGRTDVAYAVLPRCQPQGSGTLVDEETGSESHEMAEAATDPYPMTNPAFAEVDTAHFYWQQALGGSEVGDMCAQDPAAFVHLAHLAGDTSGLSYVVQRIWSNAAVAAGRDPCQPELAGETYFNASPEMNDMIPVNFFGQTAQIVGVDVSGGAKTINLDLYSEGMTSGPWTVDVQSLSQLRGNPGTISYSVTPGSGSNGDKLQLSITPTTANPGNLDIFFVTSTLGSDVHFWVGAAAQ